MSLTAKLVRSEISLTHDDFLAFWRGRPNPQQPSVETPADVIERLESAANRGCGQFFELYQARLLRSLRAEVDRLAPAQRIAFQQALWVRQLHVDDESIAAAEQAELECMDDFPQNEE